jgi:hypothetical protein
MSRRISSDLYDHPDEFCAPPAADCKTVKSCHIRFLPMNIRPIRVTIAGEVNLAMKALVLAFVAASTSLGQQHASSPNPILDQERSIAAQMETHLHIKGFDLKAKSPQIRVETKPNLSSYHNAGRVIREARWQDLPHPLQTRFNLWASYTEDEPSGEQFFNFLFYRYFFVREMGHWLEFSVLDNKRAQTYGNAHRWQSELEANRISVAWWREQDPAYLAKVMKEFRAVRQQLPRPVPPGQDIESYFVHHYDELSKSPETYTWFQIELALSAADERPAMSFQQIIDRLPGKDD